MVSVPFGLKMCIDRVPSVEALKVDGQRVRECMIRGFRARRSELKREDSRLFYIKV